MRPLIETILAALLIALAAFLFVFGVKGFVLIGLPFFYVPGEWQTGLALASLSIGGWVAVELCLAYPEWRRTLAALTLLLIVGQGVLAFVV